MQRCKLSNMCQYSGTVYIDFWQFLAQRHIGWIFVDALRLFATCSLTLIPLSKYDLMMRKQ